MGGGPRVTVLDAIPDPAAQTVVRRYFDLVNADEVDAMMELFAEDATIEPSSGGVRRGRDDIAAYYRATLAGFAEHHDEPRRVHVARTAIVIELAFVGVATSGAPVTFDALDLFELEGGRIRRVSLWADTAAIARQLRRGSAARTGRENA
jgi:uncharacterized protein (TIGR02246 family)